MKGIDESWRFLEDFFKSDVVISANVNKILRLTTRSSVREDNFDVFFEDIMKLIPHKNGNLTYSDFLYPHLSQ